MENTRGTKKKMLLTAPQGSQGVFTEGQSGAFSGEEEVDSRLTPLRQREEQMQRHGGQQGNGVSREPRAWSLLCKCGARGAELSESGGASLQKAL